MTPKDLKPGYLVRLKDGDLAAVSMYRFALDREESAQLVVTRINSYEGRRVATYNDDFSTGCDPWVINKVYGYPMYYSQTVCRAGSHSLTDGRTVLWARKEKPPVKKMIVAEVCKALGYDVEIVKDGATDA